jgi:hypothetical protein
MERMSSDARRRMSATLRLDSEPFSAAIWDSSLPLRSILLAKSSCLALWNNAILITYHLFANMLTVDEGQLLSN